MSVYRHTQKAPWFLMLAGFGVLGIALTWAVPGETVLRYIFSGVGLLMLVLAAAFQHLTVEDEGDKLAVRFGPLPLFQRRIRYEDIQEVGTGRTTLLDGWGIHMSLQGGWVWNIWGRDCVVLKLPGDTLRIGTDDVENLLRFLQEKVAARAGAS